MTCTRCSGRGRALYGSGSTYLGGMGTASCTHDICDLCWGSGDSSEPFADLRARDQHWRERVAAAGLEATSAQLGAYVRPAYLELVADAIEALGRKRKLPADINAYTLQLYVEGMAGYLRRQADLARRGGRT